MKKIIIICSLFLFFGIAGCRTTSTNPGMNHKRSNSNKSYSTSAVKNGQTTNNWNSRKNKFSKPKYKKILKKREKILKRAESDKRFFFF